MTVSKNSDMAYPGSIVTLTPIYTTRGQEPRASFRNVQLHCFDRITRPWYSEGCIARGGFSGSYATSISCTTHGLKMHAAFIGQSAEENISLQVDERERRVEIFSTRHM